MTIANAPVHPEVETVDPLLPRTRESHIVVALVAAWLVLIALTLAISIGSGNRTGFVTTDITTPTPSPLPTATYPRSA
jgi:hypothetical protein